MRFGKVAAACAVSVGLLAPVASAAADDVGADDGLETAKGTSNYVVALEQEPVIAYTGGEPGLPATAPAPGESIDRSAPAVEAYVDHLAETQDDLLAAVGAPASAKLAEYTYAANGFTAALDASQAKALEARPGVAFVAPDTILHVQREAGASQAAPTEQTVNDFLGLTAPDGPYANGITGEDVVIGVVDTGIWPEHPSFADDGSYRALTKDEFSGTGCDFGNTDFNPDDAPFTCNNKLVAAKSYGEVFHGGTGDGLAEGSFLSARDEDGHGTHTSSTAGGNAGVEASIFGRDYGTVSGIAPRARVSMYKACWATGVGEGGCAGGDLADAIDAAVADGVDVINFSIGSPTPALAPFHLSLLFANDAGVFVSVSAGNNGPGDDTIGSPSMLPWVTSVAASTSTVGYTGSVTLGDGRVLTGVSVTDGVGRAQLVDAADLGNPTCDPNIPFRGSGQVRGKIVLCERGPLRALKSFAVQQARGVGMILFNTQPLDEMSDNHYIPTVHVNEADGQAIREYIDRSQANRATASIQGGAKTADTGNEMTYFSSRGENLFSPDIISPDVTAPGLRILAGGSPAALVGAPDELFQAIAGTSMSSPHTAGTYALLKQAHPDWTAAQAKSALMTSARQDVFDPSSGAPADPFDFGAGHIRPGGDIAAPGSPFDPGLTYDAGVNDYLGYLCEAERAVFANPDATCANLARAGVPTTAENLNQASIGVGDVTGNATVSRTVTNVSGAPATWTASVEAPAGFTVAVDQPVLELDAGESATFDVTFTRTDAAFDTWSFGSLTWTGSGGHEVRSPIALRALQFSAPPTAIGTGTEGSGSVDVKFGYDGAYTADASGMLAATETPGSVVDDPANDIDIALETGVGITTHTVTVPDGTALARFALFDDETDGEDDLDLYVFGPDSELAGSSGSPTAQERVDLTTPAAGDYTVVVHGWQTDGPDANYTLFTWNVPTSDGDGSLDVTSAPTAVVAATTGTVNYAWSGLAAGTRYLGAITHTGPDGLLGVTALSVDT